MSPAEVAWRARDRAIQAAWTRRQVTNQQLPTVDTPAGTRAFTAVLPAGTAVAVPEPARAALLASADKLLDGEWDVLGTIRTEHGQPGLVP